MEINVTVTKEQIIDAMVDDSDTLDIIKEVDTQIAEWDFTIKAWLYFDAIIQGELSLDNEYSQELRERIELLRTGE